MTSLFGHQTEIAAFSDAIGSGRMHHAWLLTGPQGVGKARFADMAALRYLAEGMGPVSAPGIEVPAEHPAARYIAAGSHPDFQRLERIFRDKTNDYARNINIEQVRGLQGLFATTPSFSTRRAIVIDSIDDLERGAANALLKNLEEPPTDSLFLLVSHAPGRLLPTIRSRCRVLRFGPLADTVVARIVRETLDDAEPDEVDALVKAGEGSPGRALGYAGLDIGTLDNAMDEIARTGDPYNAARAALAKSLATKAAQMRYEAFLQRVPAFIAARARERSGPALHDALGRWEEARNLAGGAVGLSLDAQGVVFELATIIAGLAQRSSN